MLKFKIIKCRMGEKPKILEFPMQRREICLVSRCDEQSSEGSYQFKDGSPKCGILGEL